jgi:preprotein translocase subunit SecF
MKSRNKRPEKSELELSENTREVASFAIMYAILGLIFYVFVRYYPTHSTGLGPLRPW